MNAAFAVIALVTTGWVTQDATVPVEPTGQNLQPAGVPKPLVQPAHRTATSRPARSTSASNWMRPRMPLSPTDPRTYDDGNLPLPPTMGNGSAAPGGAFADARMRYGAASPEAGGRGGPEKPFGHIKSRPNASPYFLVYRNVDTSMYANNANSANSPNGATAANNTTSPTYPGVGAPPPAIAKPFDYYNPPSGVSPYMLLNSNTANGTVSAYNAYVRPALAAQGDPNSESPVVTQGSPTYPSVFLNQGQYVPNTSVGH